MINLKCSSIPCTTFVNVVKSAIFILHFKFRKIYLTRINEIDNLVRFVLKIKPTSFINESQANINNCKKSMNSKPYILCILITFDHKSNEFKIHISHNYRFFYNIFSTMMLLFIAQYGVENQSNEILIVIIIFPVLKTTKI